MLKSIQGSRFPSGVLGLGLLLLSLFLHIDAGAREFELICFGGAPKTLGASMDIAQTGHPDLDLSPTFKSEPFSSPLYYSFRLAIKGEGRSWALDFLHHKLILADPPAEIQSFSITHGYNIATLVYLLDIKTFSLGIGAGAVLAHPENEVRNQVLDETGGIGDSGYYLAGPALQLGVARRLEFSNRLFLLGEARLTVSSIEVPIHGGETDIREASAHFLAGLGFSF